MSKRTRLIVILAAGAFAILELGIFPALALAVVGALIWSWQRRKAARVRAAAASAAASNAYADELAAERLRTARARTRAAEAAADLAQTRAARAALADLRALDAVADYAILTLEEEEQYLADYQEFKADQRRERKRQPGDYPGAGRGNRRPPSELPDVTPTADPPGFDRRVWELGGD